MKSFIAIFLSYTLVFLPSLSMADVWDSTFDTTPAGSENVSTGAQRIRESRLQTRQRLEVEHFYGSGTDGFNDDNGLHRVGSARAFYDGTAPTVLGWLPSGAPGTTIADMNNADPDTAFDGVADLDDSATNSGGALEDDVGHGRLWMDQDGPDDTGSTDDDMKLYGYVGVAGNDNGAWAELIAQHDNTQELEYIKPGAKNLVINGGAFDAMDGDGDTSSTTVAQGWTNVGSATIGYAATDATEGNHYEMNVTDSGTGGDSVTLLLTCLLYTSDAADE